MIGNALGSGMPKRSMVSFKELYLVLSTVLLYVVCCLVCIFVLVVRILYLSMSYWFVMIDYCIESIRVFIAQHTV